MEKGRERPGPRGHCPRGDLETTQARKNKFIRGHLDKVTEATGPGEARGEKMQKEEKVRD